MESLESFAERVLTRTGQDISELPVRHVASTAGGTMGHIMCARRNVYVCAVGYPSHTDEETGIEIFETFEIVIVK